MMQILKWKKLKLFSKKPFCYWIDEESLIGGSTWNVANEMKDEKNPEKCFEKEEEKNVLL